MRTLAYVLLFSSTAVTLPTLAFADDPSVKPAFALMDNTGDGSKVNLDVAAIVPTDSHADGALFRSSFLGQYVAPSGFGGYAGISASTLLPERDFGSNSGIGNLELGGLFRHALSAGVDLGIRVGFVVPTASGDDRGFLQLASTAIARPADLATAFPAATTWLRLGVSPTYHRGPVFLRADLGVDVPVRDDHQAASIEHINLGVGIGHHGFSATAEMQTVFVKEPRGDDRELHSFHTAGLSARYQGAGASPFLLVSTPLEDGLRGEVFTVTAGLTIPF